MLRLHLAGVTALTLLLAAHRESLAQDVPTFRLMLRNGRFDPAEVVVPAGTRFLLVVRNENAVAAEFESKGLNAEKIISAGREATIRVGALDAGRYVFENEFDRAAQGVIVAVATGE